MIQRFEIGLKKLDFESNLEFEIDLKKRLEIPSLGIIRVWKMDFEFEDEEKREIFETE